MGLDMYLMASKPVPEEKQEAVAALVANCEWVENGEAHFFGYDFGKESEKMQFQKLLALSEIGEGADPSTPSASVQDGEFVITVGYWRKANQIHRWFVENVQGGVDECQVSPVGRAELVELREIARQVLDSTEMVDGMVKTGEVATSENPVFVPIYEGGKIPEDSRTARELLPTAAGFFFGGTDYDEGYYRDLQDTVEIIDRVLALPDEWSLAYQSSW